MFERRRILLITIFAVLVGGYWLWLRPHHSVSLASSPKIYIASIVEIEPIAELRRGFRAAIDASTLRGRVEFEEKNALGDPALIENIATEVARDKPTVVYVLGTPLAQAIQQRAPHVTMVQGGVTDPVAAKLADSWSGSGRAYAATSDKPPVNQLVKLMQSLTPNRRILGVLYNPSESNSLAVVRELQAAAKANKISVKEFPIGTATDLPIALSVAVRQTDILFIPPDNLVTSGLRTVIETADAKNIPVFATTEDAVHLGALASVTTDFVELGRLAGNIAVNIIAKGVDPAKLPIQTLTGAHVVVSKSKAKALGITLPPGLSSARLIS